MPRRELKDPKQVEDWPKLKRGEPRDRAHEQWARRTGLVSQSGLMPGQLRDDWVWGPYPNYQDIARFEYGRRLWRSPEMRAQLVAHWTDPRHPYRERFVDHRQLIEEVLSSSLPEAELDLALRGRDASLRSVVREIPPVFGSFFSSSSGNK